MTIDTLMMVMVKTALVVGPIMLFGKACYERGRVTQNDKGVKND